MLSDATGAVVSGAKVTVTNQNTGFTRTVTTDAAGEYTAPSIPTGVYTLLVELTGFKSTALSQIAVGVDQRVRIDATLEVGDRVVVGTETGQRQTRRTRAAEADDASASADSGGSGG